MTLRLPQAAVACFAALTLLTALPSRSPLGAQQGPVTLAELLQRPVDPARRLTPGEPRTGTLDAAAPMLSDESRVQLWYFEGKQGQRARVTQRSSAFDTYLHLGLHGGEEMLADNDDADDTNSEIALTLPADGIYVVVANAYSGEDLGDYVVALTLDAPSPGLSGPATPATVMLREAEPTSRLGLGQTFGSQLDAQDPTMDDGTRFELWHVRAAAGDTLLLAVESREFAPAIHVGRQGEERVLAESLGDRRAVLRIAVPTAGTFAIVVRAQGSDGLGSYVLDLRLAGAPQ